MQKRTREILAVALLALLLVAGGSAMGYYLFIGHNWNVAASNIDDTIGQMDGYTVLLYAGTRTPEGEEEDSNAASSDAGLSDDEPAVKLADLLDEQAADLERVVESYREKGANVFVLDVSDLHRYSEPFVVAKNGMRIGLLSAGKAERRSDIRADALYLSKKEVSLTVAVTNDERLDEAAEAGLIGDVSIIVCDDQLGRFPNGRYCGSTFCAHTPYVGEVGVLIVSPSGVLSVKTIDGRDGE